MMECSPVASERRLELHDEVGQSLLSLLAAIASLTSLCVLETAFHLSTRDGTVQMRDLAQILVDFGAGRH